MSGLKTNNDNTRKGYIDPHTASLLEPEEDNKENEETEWSDYGRSLKAGAARLGKLAGGGMQLVGMDETGESVEEYSEESMKEAYENFSDPYKKEIQKTYFSDEEDETFGEGWGSIPKLSHSVLSSLPGTAAGMAAGGGIGGVLAKAGMSAGMAGLLGMGAGEGAVAGGMEAQETYDTVMDAPLDEIKKTEEFQQAYWSQPKDRSKNERIKQAREQAAQKAATQAGLATGAATGVLGAPSGHFMGRVAGGEAAEGVLRTFGKGTALEGLQEAPQEATQTTIGNVAEQEYAGSDVGTFEGAGEGAAAGLVTGAAMGGVASGSAQIINAGIQKKHEAVAKAQQQDDQAELQKLSNDKDIQKAKAKAKQVLKSGFVEAQESNEEDLGVKKELTLSDYGQIKNNFPDVWNQWLQEKPSSEEEANRKEKIKTELQEYLKDNVQAEDVLDTLDKRVDKYNSELEKIDKELQGNVSKEKKAELEKKRKDTEQKLLNTKETALKTQNNYQEVPRSLLQHVMSTEDPELRAEVIDDRVAKQQKSREDVQETQTNQGEMDPSTKRPNLSSLDRAGPHVKQDPDARRRADVEEQENKKRREAGTEVAVSSGSESKQNKTYNKLAVKRASDKVKSTQRQIDKYQQELKKTRYPQDQRKASDKLDQYEARLEEERNAVQFIEENVDKVPQDFALHVTKANRPIEAAKAIRKRLAQQQTEAQRAEQRPSESGTPHQSKRPTAQRKEKVQPKQPSTGQPVPSKVPAGPVKQQQQSEQVQTEQNQGRQTDEQAGNESGQGLETDQEVRKSTQSKTEREKVARDIAATITDPNARYFTEDQVADENISNTNLSGNEVEAVRDAMDNQLDKADSQAFDTEEFIQDVEQKFQDKEETDKYAKDEYEQLKTEEEKELSQKVAGRIREMGGLSSQHVKSEHGQEGVQELQAKFGYSIVKKDGWPMDVAAQIIAEETPEVGIESGDPASLWDFLTEQVKSQKQIEKEERSNKAKKQKEQGQQKAAQTKKKQSGQQKATQAKQKKQAKPESEKKTEGERKTTQKPQKQAVSEKPQNQDTFEKQPYEIPLAEYEGDKAKHFQSIKTALKDGNLSPEKALEIHGKDYSIEKFPEYKNAVGEETKESESKPQQEEPKKDITDIEDEEDAAEAIEQILKGDASFKGSSLPQEMQKQGATPKKQTAETYNQKASGKNKKKGGQKKQTTSGQTKQKQTQDFDVIAAIYDQIKSQKVNSKVKSLINTRVGKNAKVKQLESGDILVKASKGRSLLIRPNETIWADGQEMLGATQGPSSVLHNDKVKLNNAAVITLSKNYPNEIEATLDHEMFHAAKLMALNDSQIKLLDKKFDSEEAQAEAYEKWTLQSEPKHPYFRKIRNMFDGVDKIFKQIQSGKAWEQPIQLGRDNQFYQPKRRDISYKPDTNGVINEARDDLEAFELDHAVPLFKKKSLLEKNHPDKQETLRKVGLGSEETNIIKSAKEKINLSNAKTMISDRYHPIKQMEYLFEEQTGVKLPRHTSSYIAKRLSTSSDHVVKSTLEHGFPVHQEGGVQIEGHKEGLYQIMSELGNDMYPFLIRRIIKRSDKIKQEDPDKEKLIDDDVRADLQEIVDQYEDKQKWDELDKRLEKLQKGIVQFAVDSGIISQEAADSFEYASYLPFYRQIQSGNEEVTLTPTYSKQFINNGIKELKGSENPIGDPLENLIQNWGHLITESIQNDMLKKAVDIGENVEWEGGYMAEQVGPKYASKNPKEVIGLKLAGKTKYYKIRDPAVFNALTDMSKEHLNNAFAKLLRGSKRALTLGATLGPVFRVRNVFRDSLHVAIMNKSFRPFLDSWKGAWKAMNKSQDYKELQAAMGSFSGGYLRSGDPKDLSVEIGKLATGRKRSKYSPVNIWHFWQSLGDAMENAARIQLYSQLRDQGASIPDAAYQAKDVMDFTLSGASSSVQWAIQAIPFLNARLQGLTKIGKEVWSAENTSRKSIAITGALYGMASLVMLGISRSGEENRKKYDMLPDYEKFMYHHLFVGDTHVRLPMPFELGAVFGAGPIAAAEAIAGSEDADHLLSYVGHTMGNTLSMNPVPQAARPLVEQWGNKDFFTGREIIPIGMQNLKKTEQADPWTSKTLKAYGDMLHKTGLDDKIPGFASFLKSPKRVENMIEGYLSTIGTASLGVTDMMATWAGLGNEDPAMSMRDYPFVGAFVRSDTIRRTGYTNDAYDMVSQIDEIVATGRYYRRNRNPEALKSWMKENKDKLKYKDSVKSLSDQLSLFRRREQQVWKNDRLSKTEKRKQLDKLTQQRNEIVSKYINKLENTNW